MSNIILSKCLFVDLKTDEQRRDWFSMGRGAETGVIAPALQPHLVNAYSKIVENSKLIEQQQQRINELENTLAELGYCTKCSMIPKHHFDEPFSTCACGTGEDYATRPLQIMQTLEKYIEELTDSL